MMSCTDRLGKIVPLRLGHALYDLHIQDKPGSGLNKQQALVVPFRFMGQRAVAIFAGWYLYTSIWLD